MRHETLSADPDLEQAIDDLLTVAAELRSQSARFAGEVNDVYRRALQSNIRDLYARIDLRAGRIGTTGAALVEVLNAALDAKARRGRPAPVGDTSRTLMTRLADAVAREEQAHLSLTAAQREVADALKHRLAVTEACKAFGIERLAR